MKLFRLSSAIGIIFACCKYHDGPDKKYKIHTSGEAATYLNLTLKLSLSEIKLTVCSVDLLSSKTGQNRKEHHTDLYHGEELIIRRGQTFQVELELNRPFDADTDKLHMDLKTGMEQMDSVSVLHQIA